MDSGSSEKRKKGKADDDDDRLSSLSNDLIHKILSFIGIKDTVKTIVLSSRYRFIWTTMPYLNFSTEDFPNLPKYIEFVEKFLTRRNSQIDVISLKLRCPGKVTQPFVKKLMDYAFSHNIQQLDFECLPQNDIEFPLSLFSFGGRSLKHLSLKNGWMSRWSKNLVTLVNSKLKATSTLELLGLTTLYLENVTFCSEDHPDNCVGLLSKCANLKNLTLKSCVTNGLDSVSICHPGLSNLTLDAGLYHVKVVNVVAPQLENLTIRYSNRREHVISAPNLASLAYKGYNPLHLSTSDGFLCLKEADICVIDPDDAYQMVGLLQQLQNVKYLKLNMEIIELLSSSVELISHEPSPFINLKSLTIYPKKLSEREINQLPKGKVNLSTEVKYFLLDSSPGATFTMFSREEILALKDAASAKNLMTELRVLLEQEKADTKTKGKAPIVSNNAEMKMQLQIGGNRALIKSYWKDLSVQFKQRKAKAYLIISKLESIEELLKKLPASNRAIIQPYFSSLCAEADNFMSKIMKMQCDEIQSRTSVFS